MRIFLAIEIPDGIKKDLVGIQEDLKPLLPDVRWEKPEKLHVTLVFLGPPASELARKRGRAGEVSEERIADLEGAVRKGVKGMKGIKVGLSRVGFFPEGKRPRVVLVEVGEGREQVVELQKRLAEALAGEGFDFARLSKPHVTLGRFRRGADATRRVNQDSTLRVGGFEVKEVVVVESKLHPAGAIHTPLVRVPLGEQGKRGERGA